MGVNLQKNSSVSLTKESDAGLTKITLGVGWDVAKKAGGFLGSLLGGGGGSNIDLDASCIVFDARGEVIDTIWFGQLKSCDGAIHHSGDNLTGEGDGDDESIVIDLTRLSPNAETLVLTVNSFRGQTFDKIANAYGRVIDNRRDAELARFAISDSGSHTGLILASLKRDNGAWTFKALGERASGRRVQDLASLAACLI